MEFLTGLTDLNKYFILKTEVEKLSSLIKRFRRKKEEVKEVKEKPKEEKTPLEILCAEEPDVYEALKDTMFLDPRKMGTSLEEAIQKAKEFKKSKDITKAMMWYKTAGGLAIFEGNITKVKECFGKWRDLRRDEMHRLGIHLSEILKFNPKILEPGITKRALEKAKEYYEKHLPPEEAKK